MSIEIDAVYENGKLTPDRPLPLQEKQRVRVVIQEDALAARRSYGIMGWSGDPEVLRRIALDPEQGLQETP